MRFRAYPDSPGCSDRKASKLITGANTLLLKDHIHSTGVSIWSCLLRATIQPTGLPWWFSGKESA